MQCENCSVAFEIFPFEEGTYARNLCICEQKKKCNCGLKATQVIIRQDGKTIVNYACDEHGLADTFKPLEVKETEIFIKKSKKEKVDASLEYGDTFNAEWIKKFIAKDTYKVICSSCKHEHNYSDREVTDKLLIICPKCKGEAYKLC
jgi:hypothetical protein